MVYLQYVTLPLMGIKYSVDEKFFEKWSAEMAYVLGYLYADGSMEDAPYLRGKYIRVSSIDKSSIIMIRELLKSKHTIVVRRQEGPRHAQYLLRIGSHKIYNDLIKLGLYPNKSLTIKLPYIPSNYFAHFLRGYFDGDGCVFLETGIGAKGSAIVKRLSVIFTSGSRVFLEQLDLKLRDVLLNKEHFIHTSQRAYQLRFRTRESVQIFSFLYRNLPNMSYLRRKLNIFIKYFILRPSRIDTSVRKILYKVGCGHVVK